MMINDVFPKHSNFRGVLK